jgi:hypothetical protein
LVTDLEPGTSTRASSGADAHGAGQPRSIARSPRSSLVAVRPGPHPPTSPPQTQ